MRRKIVAGNWKMNMNKAEATQLWKNIENAADTIPASVDVIVAPPALYLGLFSENSINKVSLSAQNVSNKDNGALTGEISAELLKSIQIDYSIVGHSERRSFFHETDNLIAEKINRCLEQDVRAIYCCGEVKEERESGKHFEVVESQISAALFHLKPEQMQQIIIAYEPVWAIGTGLTASSEQAQEMHAHIRKLIKTKFGSEVADAIRILYGGSCKPENAVELFAQPDVDGGLIGGASLKADDFLAIIKAAD